jgi:hypothetical protein
MTDKRNRTEDWFGIKHLCYLSLDESIKVLKDAKKAILKDYPEATNMRFGMQEEDDGTCGSFGIYFTRRYTDVELTLYKELKELK